MALQVDREQLDEFCSQLFRTLDDFELLPSQLGWKRDKSGKLQRVAPTELEKYPRLLFGSIQRYYDVEAGFKEWESRVLREIDSPSIKEKYYPELEALRQSMVQHKDVFLKKPNVQHLRTSLYARMFQYLYPRRVLANAYCEKHKGETNIFEIFNQFVDAKSAEDKQIAQGELEQLLNSTLPDTILDSVQKLKDVYNDDWITIVTDTKARLVTKAAYYRTVLHSEEPVALPEEDTESTEIEENEEVQ